MRAAVAFAAVLLAGCTHSDDRICATPEQVSEVLKLPNDWGSQRIKIDNCVHRWAFRLAAASDDLNQVADATIGACREMIPVEADLYLRQTKAQITQEAEDDWTSRFRKEWLDRARFYAAMAKAGKCPVP